MTYLVLDPFFVYHGCFVGSRLVTNLFVKYSVFMFITRLFPTIPTLYGSVSLSILLLLKPNLTVLLLHKSGLRPLSTSVPLDRLSSTPVSPCVGDGLGVSPF